MAPRPERFYLGLGSNLGRPKRQLERALSQIAARFQIVALSAVYESRAVDPPAGIEAPNFLNMAVECVSTSAPEMVAETLRAIEQAMGRRRGERNAPRLIDIDLLFFGDRQLMAAGMVVPHPRLQLRDFVLKPMCDLDPEFRHPKFGLTMREMLDRLKERTLLEPETKGKGLAKSS
jgi:2-amino-4-hydroxy-6-hydroxymethyldihydropteridine diphosphokinase